MDDAEDTDEMLHILAKAKDDQNARLESLEVSIKVKCKEIAYEQSRHLATLIQTIVKTEAYKTKNISENSSKHFHSKYNQGLIYA